jgi:hypothetical protein
LFNQSSKLPPSSIGGTFVFPLSPLFKLSVFDAASRDPIASQFVAVTAFCSPDSAVPPQSDRIGKTEVFLASANVVEYQTQTFNLRSSERLSAVKVVIETSETDETAGTAQAQTADSDVGSGASELSAIDLQSHRFVHSAADRPTLHQQTVQLQQSVDCPPSLAFHASAALTAAAEAIPDFSASAESGHE